MPPRASFHLMVTIALDLEVDVPEGPPVVTKEIDLHAGMDQNAPVDSVFGIGGVVRDANTRRRHPRRGRHARRLPDRVDRHGRPIPSVEHRGRATTP